MMHGVLEKFGKKTHFGQNLGYIWLTKSWFLDNLFLESLTIAHDVRS